MTNILIAVGVFAALSLILGIAIGLAAKAFHTEEDPRVDEVAKMLPGINCGSCGFPGCPGLAKAIVEKGANPKLCKPGKADMADNIRAYLQSATGPSGEYQPQGKN